MTTNMLSDEWQGLRLASRFEAVTLLTEGQVAEALQIILGDEVWETLDGITIGDVEALFNALTDHEGLLAGNLSPRALRGTRPKSKR